MRRDTDGGCDYPRRDSADDSTGTVPGPRFKIHASGHSIAFVSRICNNQLSPCAARELARALVNAADAVEATTEWTVA